MAKKQQKSIATMLANENIIQRDIVEEMEGNGLNYAVMTIIDRALPDIRDGLKPAQRRILYSMWIQKMLPTKPHRKSAGVTGDVMRWLHPHGSSYDVLCNMVNDFEIRYPSIDGQGNFGSPDGDPAAAERYTECRLAPFALLILQDIDKYDRDAKGNYINGVVDFKANFAEEEMEPEYLPSAVPYFLLNGAKGIATGYSTDSPSHNLGEVMDAIVHLIKHPDASVDELMEYVKGPDLPSGAYLINNGGIKTLYETGKASLRFRAKIITEVNHETGNTQVVITELPPEVKKANVDVKSKSQSLIEKLYDLCIEKKEIPRVIDVRDESEGKKDEVTGKSENLIRIVLELHKTAVPKLVIDKLYELTALEMSHTYAMMAVVDKAPKQLALKQILEYFIEHRRDVITRRLNYDLSKAKATLHLVDGKLIALANIDDVIKIIRFEDNPDTELKRRFALSNEQVSAINSMRLPALRKLEEHKLQSEATALRTEIANYEGSLADADKVIIGELKNIKRAFADERKTVIVDMNDIADTAISENVVDEPVVILLTNKGNIKQLPEATYAQAVKNGTLRERQEVYIQAIHAKINDSFVLITSDGNYTRVDFSDLIGNLGFMAGKQLIAIFKYEDANTLISFSANGMVKKTEMRGLKAKVRRVAPLMQLSAPIIGVQVSDGNEDNVITLVTKQGMVHRFFERGFTSTSPGKMGVAGINLGDTDEVVDFELSRVTDDANNNILLYTKTDGNEYGEKMMALTEFMPKGRASKGIAGIQFGKNEAADVIGLRLAATNAEVLLLDPKGNIIKRKTINMTNVARYTKSGYLDAEIYRLRV